MKTLFISLMVLLTYSNNQQKEKIMKFELFKLPYATNALEPVISQQTVELHWGKHVQTYVNNLNTLIQGTAFENATLEDIVKKSDGAIFNNGAQVLNHQIYFESFTSPSKNGTAPTGALAKAINETFGDFENFKKEFSAASVSIFGSGWCWLAKDNAGKLSIIKEGNAGNPLRNGLKPLLGFDVWEHSYYLDYQNRRADHINALWSIVNWKVIEKRYAE